MNTQTSLSTAILSFAFTGVLGPHPKPASDVATRTQSAAIFVPYVAKAR